MLKFYRMAHLPAIEWFLCINSKVIHILNASPHSSKSLLEFPPKIFTSLLVALPSSNFQRTAAPCGSKRAFAMHCFNQWVAWGWVFSDLPSGRPSMFKFLFLKAMNHQKRRFDFTFIWLWEFRNYDHNVSFRSPWNQEALANSTVPNNFAWFIGWTPFDFHCHGLLWHFLRSVKAVMLLEDT